MHAAEMEVELQTHLAVAPVLLRCAVDTFMSSKARLEDHEELHHSNAKVRTVCLCDRRRECDPLKFTHGFGGRAGGEISRQHLLSHQIPFYSLSCLVAAHSLTRFIARARAHAPTLAAHLIILALLS